jgi:GNAT superfamily N-acetyltransferase
MSKRRASTVLRDLAGYLWSWWDGDALPLLEPLTDWRVEHCEDFLVFETLMHLSRIDAQDRLRLGHRAYVAYLGETPVAYGWGAVRNITFGYPVVHFWVGGNNFYLYHFATVASWRGRGFYPRLLQEIIQRERQEFARFWIIHQAANLASQRGIAKAGFSLACDVYLNAKGTQVLVAHEEERALAGAALLALPLLASTEREGRG